MKHPQTFVLLAAIILFSGTGTFAVQETRNPNIVVAQLNLWYYGPGPNGGFEAYNGSGKPIVRLQPLLGKYHSSNPNVIYQQIEWAASHGVDAFSIEWFGPRRIRGSIEENLDDAFLRAPNLCKIRWCIFYDFVLRLFQSNSKLNFGDPINFNRNDVYRTFVNDFIHFAEKYFSHPQYLTIDRRPIVCLWGAWSFTGKYAEAVKEVRRELRQRGYDVYIVGDVMRSDAFDRPLASIFDANTSFIPFLIPGSPGYSKGFKNVGEAKGFVQNSSRKWRNNIVGLKVTGRSEFVKFQSAWTPQIDNRLYIKNNQEKHTLLSIPALRRTQAAELARIALKHSDPVGKNRRKIIWVNTFNNWAETTTVEPTVSDGSKYPAGNYHFDMLNTVQNVFGSETFSCSSSLAIRTTAR